MIDRIKAALSGDSDEGEKPTLEELDGCIDAHRRLTGEMGDDE